LNGVYGTMDKEEKIVTDFCNALNEDLETSLKFIADSCIYQNMPFPPVVGPTGVRDTLSGFFKITGPVKIEIIEQLSHKGFVMNERIDYFDPPKGRQFGLPVAGAFKVENGLIVEWRDYFCMQQFSQGTGINF